MFEGQKEDDKIALPENRTFGLFFALVFGAGGAYFLAVDNARWAAVGFSLAAAFFILASLAPKLLTPLNRLWLSFGLLLSMIAKPIVMGLIFFGLFSPLALFMRIIGRDELRLKQQERASYWKAREADDRDRSSFEQQF